MSERDLCFLSLHDLSVRIRNRDLSPLEVLEALLRRIGSVNPKVFAFLEVTAESAREQAKRAESEISAGRLLGPLHGIPYGAKDIINTAGIRTTHGSSFFREHVPAEDAECVARLKRAGAILMGKCNTHEFAAATTTVNPHYGTTHNPWNLERIAGGSSGGSAAAVAAGMCPGALGTDTGSSIRAPAALCGIVGLKPTHGRVSLSGVCPNTPSMDHIGPMTRTVRDAALMLQGMAGYDPLDAMSRDVPVPDFSGKIEEGVRGTLVGLCPDFYEHAEVDAEVTVAFERAVEVFRGLGAKVETVSFPHFGRIHRAIWSILGAEFAEFHRPFYEKNPDGYGEDVRARLERAFETKLDDYVSALRERELLRREAATLLGKVSVIILPTTPCATPPIETLLAKVNGKDREYLWINIPFTTPHNLTGCPALSLPMGFSGDGLPLSLQIVGRHWEEGDLLRIAHAYERATPELRAGRPPCL